MFRYDWACFAMAFFLNLDCMKKNPTIMYFSQSTKGVPLMIHLCNISFRIFINTKLFRKEGRRQAFGRSLKLLTVENKLGLNRHISGIGCSCGLLPRNFFDGTILQKMCKGQCFHLIF